MRRTFLTIISVFVLATAVVAQKRHTIMGGDTWTGVVESTNETTREITIVNPDKKTERFTGSDHGFGTAYLATKNAGELRVLSQLRIAVELKQPDLTGIFLGKNLEKRLKARQK